MILSLFIVINVLLIILTGSSYFLIFRWHHVEVVSCEDDEIPSNQEVSSNRISNDLNTLATNLAFQQLNSSRGQDTPSKSEAPNNEKVLSNQATTNLNTSNDQAVPYKKEAPNNDKLVPSNNPHSNQVILTINNKLFRYDPLNSLLIPCNNLNNNQVIPSNKPNNNQNIPSNKPCNIQVIHSNKPHSNFVVPTNTSINFWYPGAPEREIKHPVEGRQLVAIMRNTEKMLVSTLPRPELVSYYI